MRGIQFLSGMGKHEVVIEVRCGVEHLGCSSFYLSDDLDLSQQPESTELTRTVKDKSVGIYR